jgi:trans-aconitate methyltransferase
MTSTDFTEIARRYERDSLVQKAAAEVLLGLLQVGPREDVLDLGCGTGHLTERLAALTAGRVLGVDPSPGMIAEARGRHGGERVRFEVGGAEELALNREMDAIFCNSTMQWFREPARALAACRRALRPGGRMAVQAPARSDYCPLFVAAAAAVARDPGTAATFERWRSPWFFLERAEAYVDLFRQAGFAVPFARIEATSTRSTPEQVLSVFESGAAAGYLNAAHYEGGFAEGYPEAFRQIAAEAFRRAAGPDGRVELVFHRIYLLAAVAG